MTHSSTDASETQPLPLPEELRRLREARSLSEKQAAAAVGVTRVTVRSGETGRTTPRERKRETYARLTSRHRTGEAAGSTATAPAEPETEPETGSEPSEAPAAPGRSAALGTSEAPGTSAAPLVSVVSGASVASGTDEAAPGRTAHAAAVAVDEPADEPDATEAREKPDAPDAPETPETPEAAAEAFDALYTTCAATLVRQTFLLTGRRRLSEESVARAFALAWERWPEVAVDADPPGWVRAAAYEYALSPWHRLRRAHRTFDPPPAEPGARALLDALLDLPPSYRRTLLLHDGVGLGLPETAAETEASTPAAASRLVNARAAVAEQLPGLAEQPSPTAQSELLHQQLDALAQAQPAASLPSPDLVRTGSERRARRWTRATLAFAAVLIGLTLFTVATAPSRYEAPQSPARKVVGVPPRGGPEQLTPQDRTLQEKLQGELVPGPGRLVPDAG
ncbi:sigma factor-like helix-turn-helix DNA-binding protein [Streptomyces sp. NPDC052052]|uniref:sigma factor-like helix-turn-helix DNA-binding protein n=1 Tax=Streptomyces sp. NPDC052052 TaxID=3154756 RepID=UPI003412B30F